MSSSAVMSDTVDGPSGLDNEMSKETLAVRAYLDDTSVPSPEGQQVDEPNVVKTPRKRAPRKTAAAEKNGDADGTPVKSPKPTPKKRTLKAVKIENGAGNDAIPVITPQKRRSTATANDNDGATPSKKRSPVKNPYPTCRAELSEADKVMVQMKKEGKGWTEIGRAYMKITGEPLGKSTLSNRYPKILAALVSWEEGDIERMLYLKDTIDKETEQEIVEFKRKAEYDIWKKISGRMAEIGGGNYPAEAIEKGYMKEKKEGFPHMANVMSVMNSAAVGVGPATPDASGADASDSSGDIEEDTNAQEEMEEA